MQTPKKLQKRYEQIIFFVIMVCCICQSEPTALTWIEKTLTACQHKLQMLPAMKRRQLLLMTILILLSITGTLPSPRFSAYFLRHLGTA